MGMRRWLDLAIGLVAILAPAGLLLADTVASAIPPYHHIKIAPGLVGAALPIDPAPSIARVLDGKFQGEYARLIGTLTPLYPLAVRAKNQVLWSVFGMPGVPGIVVGRGRSLLEREYVDEYCSRNRAAFRPLAMAWAPKLRQMQDAYEQHGKTFLYVITPSKVAQNPGLVPPNIPCAAASADRDGILPLWLQILAAAGVHTVDTVTMLRAAQVKYPFQMYPRGGTHWNSVGAALATREIAAALSRLRGDGVLPAPDIVWAMKPHPVWPDIDLDQLLNLMAMPRSDPVPYVSLSAKAPFGGCRALRIGIVGGSFMNRPAEDLALGPCAPQIEEWQYWSAYDINWPPGVDAKTGVDPAERDARVLDADVMIYEENEQLMARSRHGPDFYSFLKQQWGLPDAITLAAVKNDP